MSVASTSGRLRKIATSRSKLDVNEVAQELATFYPLLLGVQWQTTSSVASWRNTGLVERLKTEKHWGEEQFSAIADEVRSFPEQKINVRL
jgi:hypothetical protein